MVYMDGSSMPHYSHMPIGHVYIELDWDTGIAKIAQRWPNGWITTESAVIPGTKQAVYWSKPCNPDDWGTGIGETGDEGEPEGA